MGFSLMYTIGKTVFPSAKSDIRQKNLIISLALIGYNGDAGCVLFYNIFYFLVMKGEDAA